MPVALLGVAAMLVAMEVDSEKVVLAIHLAF